MRVFYLKTNNTYNVHGDYGASGDPITSVPATMSVGDPFHLTMKMSLNTGITNARGVFGAANVKELATGKFAVPNPILFDSTTSFSFCTGINEVPQAYCEIVGFATWYEFESDSNAGDYFAGLYRTFFNCNFLLINFFISDSSSFL